MERTRHRTHAQSLLPADLDTVGLEELVSTAAMLTRIDRKYALSARDLPRIMSHLDPDTRVLEVHGQRAQAYASVYHDSPDLVSFHGAAHPRRRRFKVRTRSYLDSGIAFLEVKTRGPRGRTVKERIPLPIEEAGPTTLDADHMAWVEEQLTPLGHEATAQHLRPVLVGSYTRTTVLLPHGDGRATLDADLRWVRLPPADEGGAPDSRSAGQPARVEALRAVPRVKCPDLVVIETKSGSTPSRLDHLLWAHGHRPTRISKYATAMAALDPTLPANRWTRTLARHFAHATAL
ncbi:polyphosphate polymerase domain-containing protein [Schaalia sp. 19OD2882]|nr:polyphosphate polymerase domain-containing protein [Schaalia sp. 19OD2882]